MNLRFLSAHHLPEEGNGGGGPGGAAPVANPMPTEGRLHIQEAPSGFTRLVNAYSPHYPAEPGTQYPSDNARSNAAMNRIFRNVREASSGSGVDEKLARKNIANNVLRGLEGYESAKLKPQELEQAVDYLYKNRNYTVDESGNLLPWEDASSDVRTRQNRREGIQHSTTTKAAEGTGVGTEHRGKQVLQQ